jgi:serine/threonine-protein kinase
MGEVYRARDTKLGRHVAIKILPESFNQDPERLARFEREAKTLASLNHANIAAIYGLEEAGTFRALVLELVDGPTLADRIARGPIPHEEALPLAKQITEALEAAHEHGIIHRDLKPANIKVRPDGTVKVLDFGLAKALQPEQGDQHMSASPTITLSAAASRMGIVLGTAAYMAPEQAKGKPVDRRADVWAFGAVLYEMLTGRRAFSGDDISDTLVSVLRDDPDWAALPPDTPASTRQTLKICLQKDVKRRVRDMSAIRLALDGAFETPALQAGPLAAPASKGAAWRQVLPWALASLVIGSVVAILLAPQFSTQLAPSISRFVITTPPDAPARPGIFNGVAISPDGSRIVYRTAAHEGDSPGVLYLRDVGRVEAEPLRGAQAAAGPFFSPDGEWVGYADVGDQTLKRMSVLGGTPLTICPLDGQMRGASWGPDDTIVFATAESRGLFRVTAAGGKPERLTAIDKAKGEVDHFWPEVLPDGKGVLFTAWYGAASRSRIAVLASGSGAITEIATVGSAPRFAPSGHVVYASAGRLHAVAFDSGALKAIGNPAPVVERIVFNAGGVGGASFGIARNGSLVYLSGEGQIVRPRTLVWLDRKGQEQAINVPPRAYVYARLSPDGAKVALDSRDEANDIWIWDLKRGTLQRLTIDPGMNRLPVWTPDGARVAFSAERDGIENIHWQSADGSGAPERISVGSGLEGPMSFAPDGKHLVFVTPHGAPYDLGLLSLDGKPEARLLVHTRASETNGEISPDGRWLAYESNESGRPEIYVRPFPKVEASLTQVSTGGGTRPLWSRTGRELFYYVAPDTIMAVPVQLGQDVTLGIPQVAVKGPYAVAVNAGRHYDVSADGQRFLLLKDVAQAGDARPAATEIHLVLNWLEELRKLAPNLK